MQPVDGIGPSGIAFDSANGNLYVTNSNTDTVSVISGQTNSVIGSPIPVGDLTQMVLHLTLLMVICM